MKTKIFAVALASAFLVSASVQAVTISVVGGALNAPIGTTGQLEVQVFTGDDTPIPTFTNGGIELSVQSSNPGVLNFTGATVLNPTVFGFSPRWSVAQAVDVDADLVGLLQGASVSTPALNGNDPSNVIAPNRFLFATIDYTVTGAGETQVMLSGFDGTNDFVNSGAQVQPELVAGVVSGVPEPSTMALAGLSLIGLVLRRRND